MRVGYVYANPRRSLAADVAAGHAPDTGLIGQNHLAEHGIDARIHDSAVRRGTHRPGIAHRVTWVARELTAPWDVGNVDAIVTPLGSILPLAALLRRLRVVLLNMNYCTALARMHGARRRAFVQSLRAAADIVCFADAQREDLLRQAPLDPARVHVVPLGIDEQFLTPRPEPEETRVVAVGRDAARDYATFAAAVRDLDVPATIVASARNLAGVELPPNVTVELDVLAERMRDLYASGTCIVAPTRTEDFALGADCSGQTVLLDAMSMGRPTVISYRQTLDEYVDDGRTAVFVPPEDAAALRREIESLLAEADRRRAIGEAARAAVEANFTTRLFAARLARILEART